MRNTKEVRTRSTQYLLWLDTFIADCASLNKVNVASPLEQKCTQVSKLLWSSLFIGGSLGGAKRLLFSSNTRTNPLHKKTLALRFAKVVLCSQELTKDVCPDLIYGRTKQRSTATYKDSSLKKSKVTPTRSAFLSGKRPIVPYKHLSLILQCYAKEFGQLVSLYLLLGLRYQVSTNTSTRCRPSYLNIFNIFIRGFGRGFAASRLIRAMFAKRSLTIKPYQGYLSDPLKGSKRLDNPSVPTTQGFMHYQFHQLCTLERIFIFTPLRLGSLGSSKNDKNGNKPSVSSQ